MCELCLLFEEEEKGNDFDVFGHLDSKEGEGETEVIDSDLEDSEVCVLTFSNGNMKLDWPYLSLPAGYTCPAATVCKTFAAKPGEEKYKYQKFSNGKTIIRGKDNVFTCFAAREQSLRWDVAKKVWRNFDLIMDAMRKGGRTAVADLLKRSIDTAGLFSTPVFRIHEAGDFFDSEYFLAWCDTAKMYPGTLFYAYTTSIDTWLTNRGSIPKNMKLIASLNPANSQKVIDNNLRYSVVVNTPEEAKELGLKIDVDDSLACCSNDNFALLLHGVQQGGSDLQKIYMLNKKMGVYDKIKKLKEKNKAHRERMKKDIEKVIQNVREGILKEIKSPKRK